MRRGLSRSVRACAAAGAHQRRRRAPWVRRGRSGWPGDLCECAGRGGRSRGGRPRRSGSRGNPAAPGRLGSIEFARRASTPGALAGRVGRIFQRRGRRVRDDAGRLPVRRCVGRWWTRAERSTAWVRRDRGLAALSTVSSARSRSNIAVSLATSPSRPPSLAAPSASVASARSRVEPAQVPPDQTEHQHARRGEQHQRETLDQRVARVDQQVFDAGEFGAMEQEVGAGHRAEQDQRWLDDRGENSGLANRQHRGHTTRHIQRGEDGGQLLAGAGVESEADSDSGHGDHHCGPPRHSRNSGDDRAVICGHRRPVLLC